MALQRFEDWLEQLERLYPPSGRPASLMPLRPVTISKHASSRRAPYTRHMQPSSVVVPGLGTLPQHIQILAKLPDETSEVADKHYKRYKETRREMLERLLNPVLNLEEAARLLGVCPASVRRYTDRGLLAHHRTEGNQRRFHLADVVAFIQARDQVEDTQ